MKTQTPKFKLGDKVRRKDPRLFVTACSRAEKAVAWILGEDAKEEATAKA